MNSIKNLLISDLNLNDYLISKEDNALTALEKINRNRVGALFVTDAEGIIGLFNEQDYYRNVIHKGSLSLVVTVEEIMSQKIPFVTTNCPIEDCLKAMKEKGIPFMPIFDSEKAIGIISKEKVIEYIMEKKEFMINQLTNYITGSPVNSAESIENKNNYETIGEVNLYNLSQITAVSNSA